MRTTISQLSRIAFLFVVILAVTTTASLASTKGKGKNKNGALDQAKSFQVVGRVDKINKDRSFEVVTPDGDRYLVHVPENTHIRLVRTSGYSQLFTTFEGLRKWQHVSVTVAPVEEPVVTTSKP